MKQARRWWLALVAGCGLAIAGCGDPSVPGADGGAPSQSAEPPAEVVSVAGRVSGGGITLDVQIGHAFAQRPASGDGTTVAGAAAIK